MNESNYEYLADLVKKEGWKQGYKEEVAYSVKEEPFIYSSTRYPGKFVLAILSKGKVEPLIVVSKRQMWGMLNTIFNCSYSNTQARQLCILIDVPTKNGRISSDVRAGLEQYLEGYKNGGFGQKLVEQLQVSNHIDDEPSTLTAIASRPGSYEIGLLKRER